MLKAVAVNFSNVIIAANCNTLQTQNVIKIVAKYNKVDAKCNKIFNPKCKNFSNA